MAIGFKLMFMRMDPLTFFTNTYASAPSFSFIPATGVVSCYTASETLISSSNPSVKLRTVAFYGPSLRSQNASHENDLQNHPFRSRGVEINDVEEEESVFDDSAFSRVFDIAALRVPSEQCISLENHLRDHLLNWPRIPNIAMFPCSNSKEDSLQSMNYPACLEGNEDERFLTSNWRSHKKSNGSRQCSNPILYRDKLARTSDLHGFRVLRKSGKVSMRRRGTKKDKFIHVKKRPYRNDRFSVEVVEAKEVVDMDGLRGLLGNEFQGKMWSVSSRLLLLDERYGTRGADDMPEIIKILEAGLPPGMVIPVSFKRVGHIAYLNLKEEHLPYKEFIAKVVLDKNKPRIRTVVSKTDTIDYPCQPSQVKVLAGNRSLVTTVFENGLRFHIDMKTVCWNSRLATERRRLVSRFSSEDIVCDVFAGVGTIALSAANKVKRVYANDSDHHAVEYLDRNKILNKLEFKIEVYSMDGRRFIETAFANQNLNSITQVVMNSPNQGVAFLGAFRGIYGKYEGGGVCNLPRIHVYGFSDADNPEFDFDHQIKAALGGSGGGYMGDMEIVRVWAVTLRKWMLCASFDLPRSVAMAAGPPPFSD